MVSPGRNAALSGSPDHHSELLFFAEITEPSARITNTAFLSAIGVKPPAWLRYHLADQLPCTLTAVGLKTWPVIKMVFGFLGMKSSSPSRSAISALVFFHSARFF